MGSAKKGIDQLAAICAAKGIEHAVLSPGSRNAPLVIAFNQNPEIECHSIVDERSAGFFGLGIAQQTQKPVALACTSGSAALNYAPAIVEAYYQEIPLLILTADRPVEWVDQGDGQTIRQRGIYSDYVKGSFELIQDASSENATWHNELIIAQAIETSLTPPFGPVHINVPLTEPLYEQSKQAQPIQKLARKILPEPSLDDPNLNVLAAIWNRLARKMILCGQHYPNAQLNQALNVLSQDPGAVVLTETPSNVHGESFIDAIDRVVFTLDENDMDWEPELLITIGGQVISKRIKSLLRKWRPKVHWHIHPGDHMLDTYQSLTHHIQMDDAQFMHQLAERVQTNGASNYGALWQNRESSTASRKADFLAKAPYSDLKVFEQITEHLPNGSQLQMANSSSIRYVQLFGHNPEIQYFSNRGTSGIEGCTSTAAGAATVFEGITTLVTGDLAFLYDINGLWNKNLPGNLRIIVINNGGGGIFRFVPGPSSTEEMEPFIEAAQDMRMEHLAKAYGVGYQFCDNEADLERILPVFFQTHRDKALILEVKTPRTENDQVLKAYFNHIGEA